MLQFWQTLCLMLAVLLILLVYEHGIRAKSVSGSTAPPTEEESIEAMIMKEVL